MDDFNYYMILGLDSDATNKEIVSAFHELIKKFHPDIWPDSEMARKLIVAYKILSDQQSRNLYDQHLNLILNQPFYYIFRGDRYKIECPLSQMIFDQIRNSHYSAEHLDYIKILNDDQQNHYLDALIEKIAKITNDKDNQARIITSLVQNIPYDNVKKILIDTYAPLSKFRYPYEVLYERKGVCGEKSILLAYLLKKLGFGIVLYKYNKQNHLAVGIKVSEEFCYWAGHAFIETTKPSIMTYYTGIYGDSQEFLFQPEVIKVSDGLPFSTIQEEYKDGKAWDFLELCSKNLNNWEKERKIKLGIKYGLFTG